MTKNKEIKKISTKELKKKIEELTTKNEEYLNDLKRLQAEFENFSNRSEREKQEMAKFATKLLANKLIIFMDDFDRTLTVDSSTKQYKEGIEMIHKNFEKVLKEEGITPIESLGTKLNPELHEVLKIEPSDKEENIVIKEFQKGYMFKDKVLRPSKVIISGGKENE